MPEILFIDQQLQMAVVKNFEVISDELNAESSCQKKNIIIIIIIIIIKGKVVPMLFK
jgi:hypothetical protein